MSVRIGNKIVAGMPEKALHGIGEIFTTTDTGVIAGAVEANGGSYNLADYNSGADSIASKLAAGTLSYVSKTEFQTRVANTGACDSFGWNGTSDATFLVPKLNPWHVGKSAPVVGNGMTVGLTDGTTNAGLGTNYTPSGYDVLSGTVNYGADVGTATTDGTLGAAKSIGITTDPIKSGMVADLSETTNLRVMVQLATGATDQALETCTSVLADVSALKIVGQIITYGGTTPPAGYLKCDGAAISRTKYANLFSVIGTTFGEGDGNSTFNLPNYTDVLLPTDTILYLKSVAGSNVGKYVSKWNRKNISGGYSSWYEQSDTPDGSSAYSQNGDRIAAVLENYKTMVYCIRY